MMLHKFENRTLTTSLKAYWSLPKTPVTPRIRWKSIDGQSVKRQHMPGPYLIERQSGMEIGTARRHHVEVSFVPQGGRVPQPDSQGKEGLFSALFRSASRLLIFLHRAGLDRKYKSVARRLHFLVKPDN